MFEDEMIHTFRMLKKLPPKHTDTSKRLRQRHLGLGKSMGESAALHCVSVLREHSNRVLLPLLPSTLGKV